MARCAKATPPLTCRLNPQSSSPNGTVSSTPCRRLTIGTLRRTCNEKFLSVLSMQLDMIFHCKATHGLRLPCSFLICRGHPNPRRTRRKCCGSQRAGHRPMTRRQPLARSSSWNQGLPQFVKGSLRWRLPWIGAKRAETVSNRCSWISLPCQYMVRGRIRALRFWPKAIQWRRLHRLVEIWTPRGYFRNAPVPGTPVIQAHGKSARQINSMSGP